MSRAKKSDALPNLGPMTWRRLCEVGIEDEAALRQAGALHAYVRLKFLFPREVSLNALYAMEAALRGCHWLDLDPAIKARLKGEAAAALAGRSRHVC